MPHTNQRFPSIVVWHLTPPHRERGDREIDIEHRNASNMTYSPSLNRPNLMIIFSIEKMRLQGKIAPILWMQ